MSYSTLISVTPSLHLNFAKNLSYVELNRAYDTLKLSPWITSGRLVKCLGYICLDRFI